MGGLCACRVLNVGGKSEELEVRCLSSMGGTWLRILLGLSVVTSGLLLEIYPFTDLLLLYLPHLKGHAYSICF